MGGLLGIGWPRPTQLHAALRLWGSPTDRREELLDYQSRRLREVLRFAGEQIPYYRRLFKEAGVDPRSIRSAAELESIPVSSKLQLRDLPPRDLMPPGADPDRLFADKTSGSTGIRLELWREPFDRHLQQLFRMRFWRQVGVRLRDRQVRIADYSSDQTHKTDGVTRIRQALRIFHSTRIQATLPPEEILDELIACRPDVVSGWAGVIYEAARLAGLRGEARLRPRLVLTGAENLTDSMRQEIEESFATRVIDSYGSKEINLLAWECAETGLYHVEDDSLVLEVVRNGKPVAAGEPGEVVITGLHSCVFPLIRYRLGDVAVRGPAGCPCGAPFSTLQRIQGRTIDYYYRADGSSIQHWALATPLNSAMGRTVGRYQIVQERDGRIIYRLMPLGQISEAQIAELHRIGTERLGKETPFEVRIEDEIPCAPSGKMLQSINRFRSLADRPAWDPAELDWNWGESE